MSSATTAVGRATDKPTLRAVMEETFETQSRARLSQLLSESRKMHRRSISLSYSQGGGLEGLLLACEVAEQVMANLHSFAGPVCTAPVPARLPLVGVEGAESGAEWERVKEEFTKNETRQKNEAKAEEEQKMSGEEGERAPHARRHTRSLSDSGMVVVLQMANANQRAADRRRAQWEKKKKAQEQVLEKQLNMDEETRLAEERRREEERRERERKEQEALVARNERLLRLFVREDVAKPARDGAATEMLRQKSESERVLTINERKRSEESGDKTPRERRQQQQQQQRDVESTAESGAEDEYLRTLRSGSDIESAEEVHLGIEEWERHDEEEEDEGELWGEEATTKDGEKKKMKLMRLKKIKPKIISGRKRSRRDSRDNSKEKDKEKDKKKSGPKQLLLLQSSPN